MGKIGKLMRVLSTVTVVAIMTFSLITDKVSQLRHDTVLSKIEKRTGCKVIEIVHKPRRGLFGVVQAYLTNEDADRVIDQLNKLSAKDKILLVLHTGGGELLAAYRIANSLKMHEGEVTVAVPYMAMSAGTLIALSADKILMGQNAVLGPVDPQFVADGRVYPAVSMLKIPWYKKYDSINDNTITLIDQAQKAINQVHAMIELMVGKEHPGLAKLKTRLVGQMTHDYPIFCNEAIQLGLPVKTDIPKEFYELINLAR
ncbi:MAG: ATP-dependent Clp protease proteolytic subunit [Candidatus Aenigmatarchaeota archaeon]